jgi:hypothetical protein
VSADGDPTDRRPDPDRPPQAPPPPAGHGAAGAPATGTGAGRGFSIAGIVMGVIAVFIIPILFGPLGILFGFLGHRKGDPLGKTAMIVAAIGMVVGFVIGALLFTQTDIATS